MMSMIQTTFLKTLVGILLFCADQLVHGEETKDPVVLAYKSGSSAYFEVDIPPSMAPFTVKGTPTGFYFDTDAWYISGDSSSLTDGSLNLATDKVTYVFTNYDQSLNSETIRVGLGLKLTDSVDGLNAGFTIHPEGYGPSYFTIDALVNSNNDEPSANFAHIGGGIPTSVIEVSSAESTTKTITPSITMRPYVTMSVVAPSAVTFSEISYYAYGSDASYLAGSASFEAINDGSTIALNDASIVYNNGLFNAFVQLTSSYDTINFKAYFDEDKSSYLAELYASYLYLSTTNDQKFLQKRAPHTFTSSTNFKTSTTITHQSFTSTVYQSSVFYANSSILTTVTSFGRTLVFLTEAVPQGNGNVVSNADTSASPISTTQGNDAHTTAASGQGTQHPTSVYYASLVNETSSQSGTITAYVSTLPNGSVISLLSAAISTPGVEALDSNGVHMTSIINVSLFLLSFGFIVVLF
ncbi:unnamed protein product [Ambrosiozyma monospora]|uniref:Unnamed protein product n=1 Tax=Ambrosiozyma monospora TaxID=43982 RepID=A0A9W6YT24_AMBMO|nr:unnamed protein product [Ambrosiozyma monospora]